MGGSGFEKLKELVDHFDNNLSQIKSQQYNETQARREFIDPLFTLLGWDMDNKQGYAEAYKDVIHEDAIKVGGFTKAPDYCFRIGGTRKFFVEAKKPGVNIKEDINPAYQLRRYAWSAKLPLSILTDFEELAVYDCRMKPNPTEKASVARVKYLSYSEYLKNWEELVATFSREAVLKGSFDKYVESNKAKKGTAEVDKAFLIEIEAWRETLARNIAIRNENLTTRELNFAVQATIDRIIFLRICEDRSVEDYGRLMALQNGEGVYQRLTKLFRDADEKYNSGLFHFEPEKGRETPDTLTPNLKIDDKVIKDLLKSLYYPESPYEFSVLPADILGQVYEQFLGKVIRLTAGHQAKVEDKPEVKKAGGVYYTPTYIVDYIVKNSVGKILEQKTPASAGGDTHPLRILDPACGSGSFLLGAYEYLLTWYRDQYTKSDPQKYAKGKEPKLYQSEGGGWKLTTSERKLILLNHIYGVDIDSQAVEVTKLSLLLKVLEGETKDSVSIQRKLFNERALPDLSKNIKCGNSLIGSDFYKDKQRDLFNEEEMIRINAFDWEEEFKEVFKDGGFDAVIGNPPYGAEFTDDMKNYFDSRFVSASGNYESYEFFLEKSLTLAGSEGYSSFIVPDTWFSIKGSMPLRHYILNKSFISEIQVLNEKVFPKAKVDVCTIVLQKTSAKKQTRILLYSKDATDFEIAKGQFSKELFNPQDKWIAGNDYSIQVMIDNDAADIIGKLKKAGPLLDAICLVGAGCKPYEKGKGKPPQTESTLLDKPYTTNAPHDETFRVMLRGEDIYRYGMPKKRDEWLSYGPWLAAPRNPLLFQGPRLLFQSIRNPKLTRRLIGTIVDDESVNNNSITNIVTCDSSYSLKYILGILNSNLLNWYFATSFNIVNIDPRYLKQVAIKEINLSNKQEKAKHDKMVSLVTSMLSLNKKLQSAKTEQDRTFIQRQITATDKEIDHLVYELYGLTEDEIKIVEGDN